MKKAFPFAFYFLFYAAMASYSPFLVLYYQQQHFSGAQIGVLGSLAPLIMLFGGPFWAGLADATHRHKLVLVLSTLCAAVGIGIFPFFHQFAPLIVLLGLSAFLSAPITALADSATMSMLGSEQDKYGRIRLGGTIGWAIAAPLAGLLVERQGIAWGYWAAGGIMAALTLVSLGFVFPRAAVKTGQSAVSVFQGARKLLSNRRWALVLSMALVCGIGFSGINNYLYPYMSELRAPQSIMGLSMTVATIGELAVFFFSNRLLKRFGSFRLLQVGMVITAVRLLLYAVLNTPEAVLVSQLINGFAFPIFWAAGVSYAFEHAPEGMSATAQGLFGSTIFGFGAAAGNLLGGPLLSSLGGHGLFLVFGCLVAAALAITYFLDRILAAGEAKLAIRP